MAEDDWMFEEGNVKEIVRSSFILQQFYDNLRNSIYRN